MASLMNKIIATNKPQISPWVRELLLLAENKHGVDSSEYRGIYNQYFVIPDSFGLPMERARHFHAEVDEKTSGGLERFYRRVAVVDLVSTCAAECSYCVRGYYGKFAMNQDGMSAIVNQIAQDPYLKEILITGGDPLIAPKKLKFLITAIAKNAPNIRYTRIGTRLPVQAPDRIDASLTGFFAKLPETLSVEMACQINHPFELQDKVKNILKSFQDAGVSLYSQNVLLKGVNDNAGVLFDLYDELRYLKIPPHYLFHAVPIKGSARFRTSVARGLELARTISTSGLLSGRAKPQFTVLTDVGKINLYEGSILSQEAGYLRLKSSYRVADRLQWNPAYKLPESAYELDDGTLAVDYLDGTDD